jgi:hypothetical protein
MSTYRISARTFQSVAKRFPLRRGMAFGAIIIGALIAFEMFNYSTTEHALSDLLGDLRFAGLRWATILAIAFCGIDFAGYARLHTPKEGNSKPNETWYLFGAWLMAATMNAMLTWWGVSLAIANHTSLGNAVIEHQTLLKVVPIFVALLVWLIRVMIIGTFATAGTRLLTEREPNSALDHNPPRQTRPTTDSKPTVKETPHPTQPTRPFSSRTASSGYQTGTSNAVSPASIDTEDITEPETTRLEPVYTPVQSTGPASSDSPYPVKPGNIR